jgi:hypothetical protein
VSSARTDYRTFIPQTVLYNIILLELHYPLMFVANKTSASERAGRRPYPSTCYNRWGLDPTVLCSVQRKKLKPKHGTWHRYTHCPASLEAFCDQFSVCRLYVPNRETQRNKAHPPQPNIPDQRPRAVSRPVRVVREAAPGARFRNYIITISNNKAPKSENFLQYRSFEGEPCLHAAASRDSAVHTGKLSVSKHRKPTKREKEYSLR